jgi:hypothetical protein
MDELDQELDGAEIPTANEAVPADVITMNPECVCGIWMQARTKRTGWSSHRTQEQRTPFLFSLRLARRSWDTESAV